MFFLERLLARPLSRSRFLRICAGWLIVLWGGSKLMKAAFAEAPSAGPRQQKSIATLCDLALVQGKDPYQNTVAALEKLGGIERFVKKGATVVVKPNIGWDRTPEQAANTNPEVVAALVELCYKAGAKRVNVFDVTCNDGRRCYENSGIEKAAKAKGARVYQVDHWNVVKAKLPYASPLEGWPMLRDAVACDCFINVPILKHHGLTKLTLSMKNLMGVCSGVRGTMHFNMGPMMVDLTSFIRPELTVIDATRVLTANGPTGGRLEDVERMDTILASTDPVLADVAACQLVKQDPRSIPYLAEAAKRGFGTFDLKKAKVETVKL